MKKPILLSAAALALSCIAAIGNNYNTITGVNITSSLKPDVKQKLDVSLKNYEVFEIDAHAVHAAITANQYTPESEGRELRLQLGVNTYDLYLKPRDFTGNDFKFLVSSPGGGVEAFIDIPVETYQGYINGDPSQTAAFSINEKGFRGVMRSNSENFYIEPLQRITGDNLDEGQYILYNTRDVVSPVMVCSVNEVGKMKDYIENHNSAASTAAACLGIRIALVADYRYYKGKGSDPVRAAVDMLHVLNITDALFYQPTAPATSPGGGFGLHFRVTTIYISTDPNEISTDSQMYVYTILTDFEKWANGGSKIKPADYDVATLFTKKNFNGNSGTGTFGLANNGGACSSKKYNTIKADWLFFGDVLEAVDLAHEVGHNLNAGHTGGTDIMSPGISESNTTWGPSTPSAINAFISSHSSCIKACSIFAPEPNFEADITLGCSGSLTVNFKNKTDFTDAATTYNWNFGDGQTSTQQNPVHTYSTSGTYTVSLTASNANGTATETKKDYIWVGMNPNPSQTLPVTPASGTPSYHGVGGQPSISLMQFQALDDIELVSMKMQGNEAGPRILSLTMDTGRTILDQKIVTLPAGTMTTVNFNWRLQKGKTYQIVATRTGTINGTMYYNHLYRTVGTALIPKTISGLITVNGNHLTMGGSSGGNPNDPANRNYWYIGFEWEVRKLCPALSVGINDTEERNAPELFPNPTSADAIIRYTLPADGKVKLSVYDLPGKEVLQLMDEQQVSGEHQLKISTEKLQNGVYFVRMELLSEGLNARQHIKKLIVQKNN